MISPSVLLHGHRESVPGLVSHFTCLQQVPLPLPISFLLQGPTKWWLNPVQSPLISQEPEIKKGRRAALPPPWGWSLTAVLERAENPPSCGPSPAPWSSVMPRPVMTAQALMRDTLTPLRFPWARARREFSTHPCSWQTRQRPRPAAFLTSHCPPRPHNSRQLGTIEARPAGGCSSWRCARVCVGREDSPVAPGAVNESQHIVLVQSQGGTEFTFWTRAGKRLGQHPLER